MRTHCEKDIIVVSFGKVEVVCAISGRWDEDESILDGAVLAAASRGKRRRKQRGVGQCPATIIAPCLLHCYPQKALKLPLYTTRTRLPHAGISLA